MVIAIIQEKLNGRKSSKSIYRIINLPIVKIEPIRILYPFHSPFTKIRNTHSSVPYLSFFAKSRLFLRKVGCFVKKYDTFLCLFSSIFEGDFSRKASPFM